MEWMMIRWICCFINSSHPSSFLHLVSGGNNTTNNMFNFMATRIPILPPKYGLNSRTASCSYKLWPAVHQSIDWGIDWERRRVRGHDDKEKGGYRQTTIPCYYYFYWNIYFNSIKQIVVGGGGWAELDNGCDWWRFCQLINRPQTHDPLAKILLL